MSCGTDIMVVAKSEVAIKTMVASFEIITAACGVIGNNGLGEQWRRRRCTGTYPLRAEISRRINSGSENNSCNGLRRNRPRCLHLQQENYHHCDFYHGSYFDCHHSTTVTAAVSLSNSSSTSTKVLSSLKSQTTLTNDTANFACA